MERWNGSTRTRKPGTFRSPDAVDYLTLVSKHNSIVDSINSFTLQLGDKIISDAPIGSPIIYNGEVASIDNPNIIGLLSFDNLYITIGSLELDDWEEVSDSNILIPNKIYYLGSPGKITVNTPYSGVLAEIGVALTSNKLHINIKTPIYL